MCLLLGLVCVKESPNDLNIKTKKCSVNLHNLKKACFGFI